MNKEKLMQRCIELGKKSLGLTYPNPNVGALIFYDGKIIGEGYTSEIGGNHAEINAINSVREKTLLKNSHLFVTMEPCVHHGNTPPCTDKIIKNQFKGVFVGCTDPNKLVCGKGIRKLNENKIFVETNVLKKECEEHHKRFITFHTKKRPYIILKWAESQDGFISPVQKNNERPFWISNKYSRQLVHKWRCEEHGIIIGSKTYFLDTPKLDGRNWNKNSNEKFIISNNKIINEPFTQINYEKKSIIKSVIDFLYKKNIQSVIVEGGLKTLGTFIDSGIWDEARIFKSKTELKNGTKAPSIIGSLLLIKKIDNDQLSIIKNIQ